MTVRSKHWGIAVGVGLGTFAVLEGLALADTKPGNTLTGRLRRFRDSSPWARVAISVGLGAAHGWLVDHLLRDDGEPGGETR